MPGLEFFDAVIAGLMPWLAGIILWFALDDLVLDLFRAGKTVTHEPDPHLAERWIAIFVPCWHESAVIEKMVRHNTAAIRYRNYRWFLGVYPNDPQTLRAAGRLAEQMPRQVAFAVCADPGPTSKADCLNWIYQRMLLDEEEAGRRYELVLTHDAEDVIHPDELRLLNAQPAGYGMIQVPVLPLPTPWHAWTHGLYCDDFAEWQSRDMPARVAMRSFVPSAGVGTAYSREALAALAGARTNRVFEPSALTEDYENGLRLHELGFEQLFLPLARDGSGEWLATREFFPGTVATAIRQRSRWATGIMLQAWQNHGWRGKWAVKYWLWRDRKSLLGHPVTALANGSFLYGLATLARAGLTGEPWGLGAAIEPGSWMIWGTTAALVYRTAFRMRTTARFYGWKVAAGVPVRSLLGNYINLVATSKAVHRFARSVLTGAPLVWVKTAHQYPSREALTQQRLPLEDLLLQTGAIEWEVLREALARKTSKLGIGEHLVKRGYITEEALYRAIAIEQGLSLADNSAPPLRVARALPLHLMRELKVIPVDQFEDTLEVASPEPPGEEMKNKLRQFTAMNLQFRLMTPTEFERRLRELKAS